jgi:hypothetical protein
MIKSTGIKMLKHFMGVNGISGLAQHVSGLEIKIV